MHEPKVTAPEKQHPLKMHASDASVDLLVSGIRGVATDTECVERWVELEKLLECWQELHVGGKIESNRIDDNLDKLLDSHVVNSIFHLSKLQPTNHTRRCIMLARSVWKRFVAAIERAEIVARLGSAQETSCLCVMRCGALSPTSKCN